MKAVSIVLVGFAALTCGAQETARQTKSIAAAVQEGWEAYTNDMVEVTCKPAYYRKVSDDSLIPVEAARYAEGLQASGVVLTIVQPRSLAGQVVAFHFDFPEPWDHWYKPDEFYRGLVPTGHVGRLAFMCDPGFRTASTNRMLGAPNPQGGANGRLPSTSETNGTPAAAASRRSP